MLLESDDSENNNLQQMMFPLLNKMYIVLKYSTLKSLGDVMHSCS